MGNQKPRLKITVPDDLLAALQIRSEKLNQPISKIVLIAIGQYLSPGSDHPDLTKIIERLDRLEELMRSPQTTETKKQPYKRSNTSSQKSTSFVFAWDGETINVYDLIARFGLDKSAQARMFQLGGKALFSGSVINANNVERVTRELDPDNLAWFPLNESRTDWIQLDSGLDYVRLIIGQEKNSQDSPGR